MIERPTPETDCYIATLNTKGYTAYPEDVKFMRDLERQRNASRELTRELLVEMRRLSHWHFPGYDGDSGIIAEIDSVISEFESKGGEL